MDGVSLTSKTPGSKPDVAVSITINTNIASLTTQRNLGNTTNALSRSFERLSSGLRINRAGDDAAGLAIADSLRSDKTVYSQGIRNLNDGLSLLNVADASLNELTNITLRIQELAEQASNGTLVEYQVCLPSTSADQFCVGESFIIWNNP